MTPLPFSVRQLAARYKTHRSAVAASHEHHDLRSLAQRVLLSQAEVLQQVETGKLLAIDGPRNGKFLFSSQGLDTLRNSVISFVASSICQELERRGADEERMLLATERAFERQFALSRVDGESLVQLAASSDDDDDLTPAQKAALAVTGGIAAGAGASYLRGRAAQGQPLLGSPGSIRGAVDTTRQGADLLGQAVNRGRKAIANRGNAVWRALRSVPFE